ncbi:MAG: amidohydrolase family protein [Mycobacteriales bacterium]
MVSSRGVVYLGSVVWAGGDAAPFPDGVVVVDVDGRVAACGPAARVAVPYGLETHRAAWVGPAFVDAHVHLAFADPAAVAAGGVLLARDLGAPLADALRWQRGAAPRVAVAGPLLTAPGGYPTRSWGSGGFGAEVAGPDEARRAVRELAAAGVDVIKVAFEPGDGGWPVPDPPTAAAVVRTAHESGLPVTAHALRAPMVARALDAGVDELCHVPTEPLPQALVDRVAAAGVPVVGTLHTHRDTGATLANAAALHAAGVPLLYGTDLGNTGTRPGVDPRELRLLAAAGPGPIGALRAATTAHAAGLDRRAPAGWAGRLAPGAPAVLVALDADPLTSDGTGPVAVLPAGTVGGGPAGTG